MDNDDVFIVLAGVNKTISENVLPPDVEEHGHERKTSKFYNVDGEVTGLTIYVETPLTSFSLIYDYDKQSKSFEFDSVTY